MPGAPPDPPLHESLLHGAPVSSERRPTRRWSYPLWAMLIVSVFVLFHASVLLIWNLPSKGLSKTFHSSFLKGTKGDAYFLGTRNTQSWGMFAPNPNRANAFVKVFVEDADGARWDLGQDIWEIDRYPYIWYDRRGKVNRRIDNKKGYQRIYGAWVCREWERAHAGVPAKSVSFVKRWTKVPHPEVVLEAGGWNQWNAPSKVVDQETVTCKTVVHGTLPNELRERYGLDPIDEDKYLREAPGRSWWDIQEKERKRIEAAAKREAAQVERRERLADEQAARLEAARAAKRERERELAVEPELALEPDDDSPDH